MTLRLVTTAMLFGGSAVLAVPSHGQAERGGLVEFDVPGAAKTVSVYCANAYPQGEPQ